jgi:transposase
MSKRRAVILAVVLEGRSQAEVARAYEVSEATVSRWLARYRGEGDAAYDLTRPRRRHVAICTASATSSARM